MKFSKFFSGIKLIKEIFDWLQVSKEEVIKERYSDISSSYGIIKGRLNQFEIVVGTNTASQITVKTGVAFGPSYERIAILDDSILYDSTNPLDITWDGEIFVSTPHSTGSRDITLIPNFANDIWIGYLQTIDESVYSIHKLNPSKRLFYKQTDGYEIKVTTRTLTAPPSNPDPSKYIYLGYVDLETGDEVTGYIYSTNRLYYNQRGTTIAGKTPVSTLVDRTSSYEIQPITGEVFYTLDEHLKAIGSGTITPTNPHGLTITDIGIGQELTEYNKILHYRGIIGNPYAIPSSLQGIIQDFSAPALDKLVVKKLLSDEYIVLNGELIRNTNLPNDTTFTFKGLSNGTYYFYIENQTLKRGNDGSILTNSNVLVLYSVVWTSPNLSTLIDYRMWVLKNTNAWTQNVRDSGILSINPPIGLSGLNLDTKQIEMRLSDRWILIG